MKHKSVEEFSVKTLEFAGLGAALQALRLPFGKDSRSFIDGSLVQEKDYITYSKSIQVSEKDKDLLMALIHRGDEHAKVMRGVCVWCEINAPRYWWQECDRYSVGACCMASHSTMHQQGRGLAEDELVEMKENLPEGTMQKRVWMFSYQTLRRIYYQRFDHRLPQWRKFCSWIESLPLADELIICDECDNSSQ